MEIAALLQILLPVLTSVLGSTGIIPANLIGVVTATAASIPTLIAGLIANKESASNEVLIALQAIQTEIAALKSSGALFTLNQANEINALDLSIQNAITAFQKSQTSTDPSNMVPLPTNLG